MISKVILFTLLTVVTWAHADQKFEDFKSEAEAEKHLGQLKSLEQILDFVLFTNQQNWTTAAKKGVDLLPVKFKKPPKDLNEAIKILHEKGEKLNWAEPKPLYLFQPIGKMIYGWFNEKNLNGLPQESLHQIMSTAFQTMHQGGRTDLYGKLALKLSDKNLNDDVLWAALALEPLCVYLRNHGRADECGAKMDKLDQMAAGQGKSIALMPMERARIHLENGELEQARAVFNKMIADKDPEVAKSRVLPWLYFDLAAMEAIFGDPAAVQPYLIEHSRLLEADNPKGVNAWDRTPRKQIEALTLIRAGKFTEAKAVLAELKTTINKYLRGTSSALIQCEFMGLMVAAAERDRAAMKEKTKEVKRLVAGYPNLEHLAPYADAINNTVNGTFKPKDLDPIKKVVGKTAGHLIEIERTLALVKAGAPVAHQ